VALGHITLSDRLHAGCWLETHGVDQQFGVQHVPIASREYSNVIPQSGSVYTHALLAYKLFITKYTENFGLAVVTACTGK
jgi:hypothetical protein